MKRWAKRVGLVLAALLVVVIGAAVVATRPWFLKGVVLPRVARAAQTDIRVGDLSFAPLSRLQVEDVRVGPTDVPLLQADLARVRYSLVAALSGKVRVDEIRVDDATVHVLIREDGTTNLPVFPESRKDTDEDREPSPHDVRVSNVRVTGLTLVFEQRKGPGREPIALRVSGLSLEVPELASGKEGSVTLSGQVDDLSAGGVTGVKGTLRGEGRLGLDATLTPSLVSLDLRISLAQGSANAVALGGRELRFEVQCAASAGGFEIHRVALTESRADEVEAVVAVTGRVQREPGQIRLDVAADPMRPAVFNIAAAFAGDLDLGEPTGTYRAAIRMDSPARLRRKLERNALQPWTIAASGQLALRGLTPRSVSRNLHDIGPFDVTADHDLTWDTAAKTLVVQGLSGRIGSGDRELLSMGLSRPLRVRLQGGAPAVEGDTVLALKANAVPLTLANGLLAGSLPMLPAGGTLTADGQVTVARQGAEAAFSITAALRDAALAGPGDARGTAFGAEAQVRGAVTDLRRVQLEQFHVALQPTGSPPAQLQAAGTFDTQQGGEGTVRFSGLREALLAVAPDPRLDSLPLERFAADGTLRWQAGKGFRPLTADLQAAVAGVRLRNQQGPDELGVTVNLQATAGPEDVAVRSGVVTVAIGKEPALHLAAEGTLGLSPAGGAAGGTLSVVSDVVDVDRLLAFAQPLLNAKPPAESAAAPAPAAAGSPAKAALPPVRGSLAFDLRRIVWNGRSAALAGTASLAEKASVKGLVLRLPAGDITAEGSLAPDGAGWVGSLAVTASGEALTELAAWAGRDIPAEPLKGTALAVRFSGAATPDGSQARVDALEVKLAQAGRPPMLALAAAKPFTLSRGQTGPVSWSDADLTVTAEALPLALANPLLPAETGLRLSSGQLQAALAVALKAEALQADIKGTFQVADLAGVYGQQSFAASRVEGALEGRAVGTERVSVTRFEATLATADARAVALSATADWGRTSGGTGTLRATVDVPAAITAAGLRNPQTARVQSLTLEFTATATAAPGNGPVAAEFTLGADAIRLADADGAALPPWALRVTGKAALAQDQIALDELALRANTTERPLASLTLAGTAPVNPMKGRTAARLTGDVLDLSGLLAVTVGSNEGKDGAGKGKTPPQEPPPGPAQEPGPFNTGEAAAELVVDLRNVTYGEIKTDVACTARLENSVVTIEPLSGNLNGAAFQGAARVNLAVQGLEYAARVDVEPMDWAPFVRTFAPSLAGAVQGSLSGLKAEVAGQGVTRPSLQRTLSGSLETGARGVVVQGLPGQAELAQTLAVPEIGKVQVTEARVKARIQDGKVYLETLRETAPDHTLGAVGTIGLDESLDVSVALGIGGALQSRLSQHPAAGYVFGQFTQQGDYMVSPAPLPFKGTLRKPVFDKNRFLVELGKAGAANLVSGLLEGKLGQAVAPGSLGGLVPGGLRIPGLGTRKTPEQAPPSDRAPAAAAEGDREGRTGRTAAARRTPAAGNQDLEGEGTGQTPPEQAGRERPAREPRTRKRTDDSPQPEKRPQPGADLNQKQAATEPPGPEKAAGAETQEPGEGLHQEPKDPAAGRDPAALLDAKGEVEPLKAPDQPAGEGKQVDLTPAEGARAEPEKPAQAGGDAGGGGLPGLILPGAGTTPGTKAPAATPGKQGSARPGRRLPGSGLLPGAAGTGTRGNETRDTAKPGQKPGTTAAGRSGKAGAEKARRTRAADDKKVEGQTEDEKEEDAEPEEEKPAEEKQRPDAPAPGQTAPGPNQAAPPPPPEKAN